MPTGPTRSARSRCGTTARWSAGARRRALPIGGSNRWRWAMSGRRGVRGTRVSRSRSSASAAKRFDSTNRCSIPRACACAPEPRAFPRDASLGRVRIFEDGQPIRMTKARIKSRTRRGLMQCLAAGPVLCAEGYVFELERRGYLQAGAFVPEVLIEHPEVVERLHRDFVHAGSDVVQALTYYVHREKLRVIGREKDLAPMNATALAIARTVARETATLFAGDICNTNIYEPRDKAALRKVARIFEEQVAWPAAPRVDSTPAETSSL